MVMFLFLVVALVVVVAAVTLAVLGGSEGGALPDVPPERFADPLPPDRPLRRADVEAVRFPMTVRGYRMVDVDEALDRLGAELAERDARIAELETALAGAQATAVGGPGLFTTYAGPGGPDPEERGPSDRAPDGEDDPAAPRAERPEDDR
ncbi:DivIVA domain-containing protein [Streptomyces sp. AN091965]|uniref:DivIVA domain-containing protein n=1 Tax=Streptomyces sp. AN091965 TaxID=2927803 RepID=UPI001F60814A|nr:DivIVA domain-containing protein [Streptomyces sp. AN091965]MCI3932881.1 DivIVA domain-containing protein [Streptomyces sp. AN091965]